MALPPGFLDEIRARVSLSDVVGAKVTWDRRKSVPAKGDWWAPCPFHQEKTPSFHVDDAKGFYYCFGCHAKGDAITFVKETENCSFVEAVERLAGMAGLEMPAREQGPEARERRDRAARLADVMEQAVAVFRLGLRSGAGAEALAYARRRGLTEETLERFEIGYAAEARRGLALRFAEKALEAEAVATGLLIKPDDGDRGGGAPYDRFRGRLMFPIRDGRGRCIGFGGRAMSPEARAKYLNSPETELFYKGRTLYNLRMAREAAGKTGQVVVAEGYMDVIALAQAGIAHAVAPLGTAITEDQLQLLWRLAPEPTIALDGDTAGLRAADKLIDLALPHLGPGRSLGFCLMPEGRDPDDVVRAGGAAAMEALLAEAQPLAERLWQRECDAHPLDTPERRGALKARLDAAVGQIQDATVRRHYAERMERAMREHFWRLDRPARRDVGPDRRGARSPGRAPTATDTARRSALGANAERATAARAREATILLIATAYPEAALSLEGPLEDMPLSTPAFETVRDTLLAPTDDTAPEAPNPALLADPLARAHPFAHPGQDPARATAVLADAIARHAHALLREAELDMAVEEMAEATGEQLTHRLRQIIADTQAIETRALAADRIDEGEESMAAELRERFMRHGGKKKPPTP